MKCPSSLRFQGFREASNMNKTPLFWLPGLYIYKRKKGIQGRYLEERGRKGRTTMKRSEGHREVLEPLWVKNKCCHSHCLGTLANVHQIVSHQMIND
jgi:hypothetical protein